MLEEAETLALTMDSVWEFIEINQNKIILDEKGNYTLYCVTAAKSISRLFTYESDYVIRYTNTTTRKGIDTPDEFELKALEHVSQTKSEDYYELTTYKDMPAFRYVQPLLITESCLECHGEPAGELDALGYKKEGLKIDDMAGAISITIPAEPFTSLSNAALLGEMLFFAAVLFLGFIVIYRGSQSLVVAPVKKLIGATKQVASGDFSVEIEKKAFYGEFSELVDLYNHMAKQLDHVYSSLEKQVNVRTVELAKVNELLNEEKEKLKKANEILAIENQEKTEFFATVSHDLRTPLTSILAFNEILERSLRREPNNEKDLEAVLETKESAKVLLDMIDNILETVRIESGAAQLHLKPVDVLDSARAYEAGLRFLAERKGLIYTMHIQPDIPVVVMDAEKIRRIIENLVSNAIRFTPYGGEVRLNIAYEPGVSSGEDSNGLHERIIITVSDTGIGISEEEIPFIFEPFTQYDPSTARRYRGDGLGLSIVKQFSEMHGGSVSVESVYSEGSTFTVVIPVTSVS
jgi:signal transduction histidine kinase